MNVCTTTNGRLVVAMVAQGWPPSAYANGVVTYTGHMATALRRKGHRVFVVANRTAIKEEAEDEEFVRDTSTYWDRRSRPLRVIDAAWYRLWRQKWRSVRVVAPLKAEIDRLVRNCNVQIVEIEEAFGLGWSLVQTRRVPIVVRLHGPWCVVGPVCGVARDREFGRRLRQEGLALRGAAGVSAPSEDVLNRVRAHYELDLPEAHVIPNPISRVASNDQWSRHGCQRGHILFVGRLDRCKGADVVIKAFDRLARQRPEARLILVGPDAGLIDKDGTSWPVNRFLENHVSVPTIRARIACLGQLSATEIADWRRRAQVTVVCSRYENCPMVALEAMAFGCPLIATDAGGLSEMVRDGQNGLLCNVEDPEDLAEKILHLLDRPELGERLGRQAAIDCQDRYDPKAIAAQTLQFYRHVLERWHRTK